MMARLLQRLDIDAGQWRALVVTAIKLDLRTPRLGSGSTPGIRRLLAAGAVNLVLGIALGTIAIVVPDVFVSGTLVLTATMFLVTLSILVEFGVVVITPLDYDVLGYQPISSPTYFAARLANVLFYTAATTTAVGILPMAAYFLHPAAAAGPLLHPTIGAGVVFGFDPLLGLAALAAFYMACLGGTLAVVVMYVAAARLVHPERLRRALTYVQLLASFAVYGGYLLLPQIFEPDALRGWSVHKSAWMLAYPPTWFASYLDLAAGHRSAMEVVPAALSVVAVVGLAVLAAQRLSLDYSEMLSRQASRSESPRRAGSRWLRVGGLRREQRAVALLVLAQFRHDHRFRLAVLSVVPLSVLYLAMTLAEGPLLDPFANPGAAGGGLLLYFAVLFIPMMLLMAVGRSDAYRASWIFHVSPVHRPDLVLAAKDLIVQFLLAPLLLALGLIFSYFFRNPLHAFVHVVVQGLIANVFLVGLVALQPQLPFSTPVEKGQASLAFLATAVTAAVMQTVSSPLLSAVIYPYPSTTVVLIVALFGIGVLGQRLLRRRLERLTAKMEFLE